MDKDAKKRLQKLAFQMAGVATLHIIIGVTLYGSRGEKLHEIFNSDFVVLFLPFILAAAGYFLTLKAAGFLMRRKALDWLIVIVMSLFATYLSSWIYFAIAVEIWGM